MFIRTIAGTTLVFLVASILPAYGAEAGDLAKFRVPPTMRIPADNPMTRDRIVLGKALFFDPRMSGAQWVSCATCHVPSLGWTDGLAVGFGEEPGKPSRSSPTLVNVGYSTILMWDGRRSSLEDQVLKSRNMKVEGIAARVSAIAGYRKMFERAYPGEGISDKTVAKAIASFERTIVSNDTPFDRWQQGNARAVSDSAKRGFELFLGKGKCDTCHQGYNFTDDGFHNIGLKTPEKMLPDVGRYEQRKINSMKGAFKTPTLREIGRSAPYMHNGMYRTLEEVVEHYDRGGDVKDNLDLNMAALNLTAREKADLVEFMKSLTSDEIRFAFPELPQ